MKKVISYILSALLLGSLAVGTYFLVCLSKGKREGILCKDLKVHFEDSLKFVNTTDVRDWLSAGYGTYVGQYLDSLKLNKIERLIESQSSVRSCQAWVTDDRFLHISISQREPALRFQNTELGFYVDKEGYIFPLHPRLTAKVPLIEGPFPIDVDKEYNGYAHSEEERQLIRDILRLSNYLNNSPRWKDFFCPIQVRENGEIELIHLRNNAEEEENPPEVFIFGKAQEIEEKMGKIEKYYSQIQAVKGDIYGTIIIKYKDQIICRMKDM